MQEEKIEEVLTGEGTKTASPLDVEAAAKEIIMKAEKESSIKCAQEVETILKRYGYMLVIEQHIVLKKVN